MKPEDNIRIEELKRFLSAVSNSRALDEKTKAGKKVIETLKRVETYIKTRIQQLEGKKNA